ncbi:Thioredoxin reductase [Mesorhizobium albiziae]|uniref:Thioredoxin reductase n=1 Tax=Neomesorhizobium albiziae TaxID=335020 RepID=A0A1I3WB03_9HYPH|nr:NAD(P)/FAD-dependent oxidoreductase [Mesorhizobium albiziae]GLS31436.1 thioredoxin reductase [Mesorhizobium albiziae]SFK03631.1 Thioredoxin reductase [Mesorhizobium albiziae]
MQYDIAVVGGSFAGLSAALQAVRARRKVLVIDGAQPRNRFSDHSHGFLGQDGRTPRAILDDAREQFLAYPTATLTEALASEARATDGGFKITLEGRDAVTASRVVLATGISDTLPDIPGLKEQWGKTVLHCPYCHGYETGGGRLGVLARNALSVHQALLVADWGDVTLFGNGIFVPDDEQMAALRKRGIGFEPAAVAGVEGGPAGLAVTLAGGAAHALKAMFTAPKTAMTSPLAEQLGCSFEDGMLGPVVKVDERQQTSIKGVYAAGDMARAMHSVALAVAAGAMAGIGAHQSLVFG